MKAKIVSIGVAALCSLMWPLFASADNHEESPGNLTEVWFVAPKQGMEAEFMAALKEHIAYRAETGEEREWNTFGVALGHNTSMIQIRHCCFNWADLDAYADAELGSERGAHWNENVHPYVDHYHHYLERTDRKHSHWPDDESTAGPYYSVTTWTLKPGAGPEPGEARRKFSQMAKEKGWGDAGNNWLWLQRIGGKPTLMLVGSNASYADMEPPETSFMDHMKEQGVTEEELSALFRAFDAGKASSDFTIWRHDKSLSTPSAD
jgi:hypothetical protein